MTGEQLEVPATPCSTCPYRCDTPPGVWDVEEYEKLATYDEGAEWPNTAVFLCHHSTMTGRDAVCRGWLAVHTESPAVRIGVLLGALPDEGRYDDVGVALYPDGKTAAAAGMAAVSDPDIAAQVAITRLLIKRARAERRMSGARQGINLALPST